MNGLGATIAKRETRSGLTYTPEAALSTPQSLVNSPAHWQTTPYSTETCKCMHQALYTAKRQAQPRRLPRQPNQKAPSLVHAHNTR